VSAATEGLDEVEHQRAPAHQRHEAERTEASRRCRTFQQHGLGAATDEREHNAERDAGEHDGADDIQSNDAGEAP